MTNKLKEITLDGVEYVLLKKEKATLDVEDKYAEIRKRVKRWRKHLIILGKSKELACLFEEDYKGEIEITIRDINEHDNSDELHFQECTLGDLQENDVFVFEDTRIGIVQKVLEYSIFYVCLQDDMIHSTYTCGKEYNCIKILRY